MFTQRDLEKLMKNVQMENIDAEEVIIRGKTATLVIKNPEVVKTNMMGKTSFQITGEVENKNENVDDVKLIMQKTGVPQDVAEQVLKEEGDMAAAIMKIESDKQKTQ
ncbi:MAG: NAC domain-containing protein [Candidatus Aenigmatarchaeota archaeon]